MYWIPSVRQTTPSLGIYQSQGFHFIVLMALWNNKHEYHKNKMWKKWFKLEKGSDAISWRLARKPLAMASLQHADTVWDDQIWWEGQVPRSHRGHGLDVLVNCEENHWAWEYMQEKKIFGLWKLIGKAIIQFINYIRLITPPKSS